MAAWDGAAADTIDPTIRALGDDLNYIRKGPGFTSARIVKTPTLRRMLGGMAEPFDNLRERLESAINSLHDPEPDLLLTVMGLTDETVDLPSLKERRAVYGQRIGKSIATVADLEPPALEHLANQLITGWYPKSPTGFNVPQSHNGIVLLSAVTTTTIRDRKWVETRNRFIFLAAFDEADYIAIPSGIPAVAEASGDFTARTNVIGRSWTQEFVHKEPMRRGEKYDLSYVLRPAEEHDGENILEQSLAFHEPTRTAVIVIKFIGERPEFIWRFGGLSDLERPGIPTRDDLLECDATSSVKARWHDVYGGLYNGIAWQW